MEGASTERLLDEVYGPALTAGEWRPALRSLRALVNSAEVAFTVVDSRSTDPVLWETTGSVLEPSQCETYRSDFMRLDPKMAIFARRGCGFLFNDADHFDDRFVARNPFYQGYSLPLGIRHTLDHFAHSQDGRDTYLAAMRSPKQGPYDHDTAARLRRASGHFVRAFELRDKIARSEAVARQAEAALDRLDFGIVVVDRTRRLLQANAFARAAFATGIPLTLDKMSVCAPTRDGIIADRVQAAINGCPSTFQLPGARSWIVSAVPLPASSPLSSCDAGAAMLVFRSSLCLNLPAPSDLMALYGLTGAEAEIAIGIAKGHTLRGLAAARKVKESTVRRQLLSVLRKLGIGRQSDVVRVLAAVPRVI